MNIDFEVWKLEPMSKDFFVDLSSTEQYMLKDYVRTHPEEEGRTYVSTIKGFEDDEFSDMELSILDEVIGQFGHLTAKELVELTHSPHSPWTMTAKKEGVLEGLLNGTIIATDFKIDFSSLLDEKRQKEAYAHYIEYLNASKSLK